MKRIVLKHGLTELPCAEHFTIMEVPEPECPPGGVVARTIYLSLDPYVGSRLRGRHMGEPAPRAMQDVIPGAVVGQVIESRSADVKEGDYIHSMEGGWQETCALPAGRFRKIEPAIAPLSAHIGVLGMPGLTAWAGVTQLAKVREGDVVLIDAAAGPVGGTAGQIARIKGASKIIGIAGGAYKCELVVRNYGFDACIDYKRENWIDIAKASMPEGASVFFENVSASMAMTALSLSRPYVRGVLCGLVASYHDATQPAHPLNAGIIIGKRAQLFGLVVYDYYDRWNEYVAEAASWIRTGQLRFIEDRVIGLENAPHLFEKLMCGENRGKAVVAIAEERR
jgi:hypothetical protein